MLLYSPIKFPSKSYWLTALELLYLDHANTVEEVLDILESVKNKDILAYGYFLQGMIQLCKLLIRKKSDTSEEILNAGPEENSNTESVTDTFSGTSSESSEDTETIIIR